jgi:hypothetical protein
MEVEVKVKDTGEGYEYLAFTIHNPDKPEECTFTNARWLDKSNENNKDKELGSGRVEITRFDKSIISGRFSGEQITHGQFDVEYR